MERPNVFIIALNKEAIKPSKNKGELNSLVIYTPVDFWLRPLNSVTIETGMKVVPPDGYVATLKATPRLARECNTEVSNSTVSKSKEMRVILRNHGSEFKEIKRGEAIAHLYVQKVEKAKVRIINQIEEDPPKTIIKCDQDGE